MAVYGDFDIFGDNWNCLFDDEFAPNDLSASTSSSEAGREMREIFHESNKGIISIATGRFKKLSDNDLLNLEDCRQSNSTKKNAKWGVKLFQEWSLQNDGTETDFQIITSEELNRKLRRFYAEAQPKNPEKRALVMGINQGKEYHKNTLKNVRSALNRHLRDEKRDIDIVKDKCFRPANEILDGKLKFNLKEGLTRPTKHKEIILSDDLIKISAYLHAVTNPVILRYRVWWDLGFHFVSRGLEFHTQLTLNAFEFLFDENETEYCILSHETKEKTRQGGLDGRESPADKRVYATGTDRCPIKSLKLLIEKTDPESTSLFNHCSKDAINLPAGCHLWYTTKSVKTYKFSRFCGDISQNAKCSRSYTAHSIRATGIQAMNDAGFELRHIMFMSGHRNESSVRSYNRECSTGQKHNISQILSAFAQAPQENVMCTASHQPQQLPYISQHSGRSDIFQIPISNPVPNTHQLNSSKFT